MERYEEDRGVNWTAVWIVVMIAGLAFGMAIQLEVEDKHAVFAHASQPQPVATLSPVIPDERVADSVSDLKEGDQGWVKAEDMLVDKDRHGWIDPDTVLDSDGYLRITKTKEGLEVIDWSNRSTQWQKSSGDHKGYIPVVGFRDHTEADGDMPE